MAEADAAVEQKTVRLQVAAARQEESGQGIARLPRSAFQALSDELAAIPRRGVVPTDSSDLILERMTEIRDQVTELAERVDAICRNAPISLC